MSSCWQIGVLLTVSRSFNITLLQFAKRFLGRGFWVSNTNFFARLFAYPLAPRRAKNVPVICYEKKKKHSKYEAFPILSCDKLRSHLQSDWLINRRSKGTLHSRSYQKRDKTQKSVYICKECILRTAKPCAPRTRKPKLHGDTPCAVFFSLAWPLLVLAFTTPLPTPQIA